MVTFIFITLYIYYGGHTMKVERILTVSKLDDSEKAIDLTRHLSASQRISMVEDLRQEITKVTHHEYPQRLRRVLTISKR